MTTSSTGKSRTDRRRAAGGFSLLELILVLLLLAIMAGAVVPSLRAFSRGREFEDAAAQLVVLTQYAQSRAIAEGRPFRLNIDVNQGAYWLTEQKEGAFTRVATEDGRTFRLPAELSLVWEEPEEAAARGYIQFYPNGGHDLASLVVQGTKGTALRVRCPSPAEPFRVQTVEAAAVRPGRR